MVQSKREAGWINNNDNVRRSRNNNNKGLKFACREFPLAPRQVKLVDYTADNKQSHPGSISYA